MDALRETLHHLEQELQAGDEAAASDLASETLGALWQQLEQMRCQELAARELLNLAADKPLSPDQIRNAYRRLAREHHPDAGGNRQRFEQLSAARDLLLQGVA